MECGQGDDEDNLMLCDGVHATNATLNLLQDELKPWPSNNIALLLGTAFQPMHSWLPSHKYLYPSFAAAKQYAISFHTHDIA